MNYDLAKKLKDAGFPQGEWIYHKEQTPKGYRTTHYYEIYVPTLSEIIEACGNNVGLFKLEDVWIAGVLDWNSVYPPSIDKENRGSTPEEAVANLYLALNKK